MNAQMNYSFLTNILDVVIHRRWLRCSPFGYTVFRVSHGRAPLDRPPTVLLDLGLEPRPTGVSRCDTVRVMLHEHTELA